MHLAPDPQKSAKSGLYGKNRGSREKSKKREKVNFYSRISPRFLRNEKSRKTGPMLMQGIFYFDYYWF